MRGSGLTALLVSMIAAPALSQQASDASADPTPMDMPISQSSTAADAGVTADSAIGRPGIRQNPSLVVSIEPMARIDNRIQNRIKSRISNRIDRYYDPRSNASAKLEAANQEIVRVNR